MANTESPYSARQLGYLTAALATLAAAISGAQTTAEMAVPTLEETFAETKPETWVAAEQPIAPAADADGERVSIITETRASSDETAIATDLSVAQAAVLSPLADTAPSEAIAQQPSHSEAPAPSEPVRISDAVPMVTAKPFFRDLPWQASPMPSTVESVPERPASRVFFRDMPWQGRTQPSTETEVPGSQACRAFFLGLPWEGGLPVSTGLSPDKATESDLSALAALATQTAIQAAQQNAKKSALATHSARRYFAALPWYA